jgi:CRP-like cAMP-binding protein
MKHRHHHHDHHSDALVALRGLGLLRCIPIDDLAGFRRDADVIVLPADDVVDRVGTRACQFVGIVDGYVRGVSSDGCTAVLGPGDQFGATELLTGDPHSMTYTTVTPTTVVAVFGPTFRSVVRRIPALIDAIVQASRTSNRERPLMAFAG